MLQKNVVEEGLSFSGGTKEGVPMLVEGAKTWEQPWAIPLTISDMDSADTGEGWSTVKTDETPLMVAACLAASPMSCPTTKIDTQK